MLSFWFIRGSAPDWENVDMLIPLGVVSIHSKPGARHVHQPVGSRLRHLTPHMQTLVPAVGPLCLGARPRSTTDGSGFVPTGRARVGCLVSVRPERHVGPVPGNVSRVTDEQ